jgi:hypothetical protein
MGQEMYGAQDAAAKARLRIELVLPEGLTLNLPHSTGHVVEYDKEGRVLRDAAAR